MPNFVKHLEVLVRQAGAELLKRWPGNSTAKLNIITKSDGTPVTDADLKSHEVIMKGLSKLAPGEMVVSEESVPSDLSSLPSDCWFVDPLDGTKPFIKGDNHFAVFVGHRSGEIFDFGMMYFPARGELIVGGSTMPATLNGATLIPNRSADIRENGVALHYANALVPDMWISGSKYPSRNLAYVDVCRGVLDAAIGSYSSAAVDLWDISAMLAVLHSLGISVVNYDGSTPKVSGIQLLTQGLVVSVPEKLKVVLDNIQMTA
jgi:myo-inositol-1(or 4)-monophosphatase